jgi:hypothetical protein
MRSPKTLRELSAKLQAHGREPRQSADNARSRSAALREEAEETRPKGASAQKRASGNSGNFRMWGAPDGH